MIWIITYLIVGLIVAVYQHNKFGQLPLMLWLLAFLFWPIVLLIIIEF